MHWNWEFPEWPTFHVTNGLIGVQEDRFLIRSGRLAGAVKHLMPRDADPLTIELIQSEAIETSAIEGETLNRESVRSSLRREFGLTVQRRHVTPAEHGIAALMVELYRHFDAPISDETLFGWHRLLLQGRTDVESGHYRCHAETMRVVSGALGAQKVHFEAPPSTRIPSEMTRFLKWFEETGPRGSARLRPVTRAALAHLYFVAIHPFEDGNGRLARALAERALAQGVGQPSLSALSRTFMRHRKAYYAALARTNRTLDADDWVAWFADRVIEAQAFAEEWVEFLIAKARLLDRVRGKLNPRQEKALLRVLREGPEGWMGGVSAGDYAAITDASPATATRDLAELVSLGVFARTGERRGARYWLVLTVE